MEQSQTRALPLASVIWCAALGAALWAAYLKGVDIVHILPLGAAATVPAVLGIVLWPFARREWAQMLIIFAWTALAIVACLAIAFVPMALLFLCAPAAAALFEREKVVEAMLLSALFAAIVFYAKLNGYAPDPIASEAQGLWGQQAGIMATIAFLIGAMYFSSSRSSSIAQAENGASTNIAAAKPETARRATNDFASAFPDPALRINKTGKIQAASLAARELFGVSSKALSSKPAMSFLAADHDSEVSVRRAIDEARSFGEPVKLVTKLVGGARFESPQDVDGETEGDAFENPYTEIEIIPGDDGELFAFLKPILEPKSASKCAARTEKIAEAEAARKTLFFAGVSHELRTPLNAIIGFSDMMRSRLFGPLPGKYAEYADLIHDSGQHMLDLIGDVLDISKVEAGKFDLQFDNFDAADVVRSSVKMLRPSADAGEVQLGVDIAADVDLNVQADRRAVRQILLNLLSNAIKFTPKGGRITVYASQDGDNLQLAVKDNGLGMSPDELSKVGTPYAQASNARLVQSRGSGLGLSLVKKLVDLHKGEFKIASHPGAGTTVDIVLPLEQTETS